MIFSNMNTTKIRASIVLLAGVFFTFAACDRNPLSGSKLTPANYDQKDMVIFKKTTYRYEDGKKFAIITFKNDEVDSKDSNLGREP